MIIKDVLISEIKSKAENKNIYTEAFLKEINTEYRNFLSQTEEKLMITILRFIKRLVLKYFFKKHPAKSPAND